MGDFLKDLWGFMRDRKKFWLAPLIIVLLFVRSLASGPVRLETAPLASHCSSARQASSPSRSKPLPSPVARIDSGAR